MFFITGSLSAPCPISLPETRYTRLLLYKINPCIVYNELAVIGVGKTISYLPSFS